MTRLLALAAHDARLQFRYGIYVAYGFVIALYCVAIWGAGALLPVWAPGVVVFSDPAALGFFFLGALMMLERTEGVRMALAVTPLTAAQYLASKIITLSGLSLLSCVVLLLALHDAPNPALMLGAVALTSIAFIGIGVPIALRFRTVNAYLVGAAAVLTPIIAPAAFALLDPMPLWLAIWPPIAQFRLILVTTGYGTASAADLGVMLIVAVLTAVAACLVAQRALRWELGK